MESEKTPSLEHKVMQMFLNDSKSILFNFILMMVSHFSPKTGLGIITAPTKYTDKLGN